MVAQPPKLAAEPMPLVDSNGLKDYGRDEWMVLGQTTHVAQAAHGCGLGNQRDHRIDIDDEQRRTNNVSKKS